MVTIFDMVTGELIHNDPADAQPRASACPPEPSLLAPRLQTLEEAKALEVESCTMPADLLQADIGTFLSSQ